MSKKISRTIVYFVFCAATVMPAFQTASACQVDEFYLTKEGALAASTPETLLTAIKFEEDGNKEKLADLVKRGMVLRLTNNVKVQVLERSVEFKTLKIKFPDEIASYWVKDGSLKQINCN